MMPTCGSVRRVRVRGAVMVMALAMTLALALLVAATQRQVANQFLATSTERDYDRALQMAEAGVNAYLNRLIYGPSTTGSVAIPSLNPLSYQHPLTLPAFHSAVKSGAISLTRYPVGSQQGYYVGHTGSLGETATIISYGWSNGIVRRVRAIATSTGVFEWATLFGLDPNPSDYCIKFSGNAAVVGPAGGEGVFLPLGTVTFYNGPILWTNGSFHSPCSNSDPPVQAAAPGSPSGSIVWGALAAPLYRHYERSIAMPTVDQLANQRSGTSQGAEYFRTHNQNQTGLRYLARSTAGIIRELSGPPLLSASAYSLDNVLDVHSSTLTSAYGMTKGESFADVRIYPGDYFFEEVSMSNQDQIYLRTYSDAERTTATPRVISVQGDPANPNGLPNETDVRIWVGHAAHETDHSSMFDQGLTMEYAQDTYRLRVYVASSGGCRVRGRGGLSVPPYNLNVMSYNRDSAGRPYGTIRFDSGTYLHGSIIAWRADVGGGTTLEQPSPGGGAGDQMAYLVSEWSELR